jgi:hypothetical protein
MTEPMSLTLGRPTDGRLSYREALQPPCLTCTTSPCCTYLLLRDFQIDTLMDVDYAVFLLNFEGIVLGLQQDRKVDVYLYQACGNLDVPSGMCKVHSTKLQPAVCVHYKSQTCSYRHIFTTDLHADKPLLDFKRMQWLAERIVFDDDRRVAGFPEWSQVLEGFASMPTDRQPAPPPPPDPIIEEWRAIVLSEKGFEEDQPDGYHHFSDAEVTDPCQGCGAWCCKTLVFDRGLPGDASQLEFLRYCLGFPSVEIGVAADSWAVIVNTTCRHLVGNRCSVFGTDERPLKCGYYDAMSCTYRGHFGVPRPDEVVRVTLGQFGVVAESIVFDDLGRIVAIPPIQVLRDRLEGAERAAASTSGTPSG